MGGYAVQRWQDIHREAQSGMTFWPLLICTCCYVVTAAGFYRSGDIGLGLAFTGYTIGNLGFLLIALGWR
jgi:hypothetical protein